jgi:DNA-directed RNA polymerase specialized sigma24 family protein
VSEDDVEPWVDWEQEAAARNAMYEAARNAGCTELQATTLVQLAAGIPARAIARQRRVGHPAVLGLRDRAMAHVLRAAGQATPTRNVDYWDKATSTTDGLTAKQRYVVSMRDWHGHTLTYIARNMGTSRQAVCALYRRGRKHVGAGEARGGARGDPRGW